MTRQILFLFAMSLFSFGNLQAQVSLSGQFLSGVGDPMGNLDIELLNDNGDLIDTYHVDCGDYTIDGLEEGVQYHLQMSKESSPFNGTSTFDMVLISKHILGIQTLNTYFQSAADVNESGSVSILDLVITRMLILGIITEFPDSDSDWLFFIEGGLQPEVSFPILLNENTTDHNFVAVKKGDVNGSADACN